MKYGKFDLIAIAGLSLSLCSPQLAIVGIPLFFYGIQKAGVVNWIEELKKED